MGAETLIMLGLSVAGGALGALGHVNAANATDIGAAGAMQEGYAANQAAQYNVASANQQAAAERAAAAAEAQDYTRQGSAHISSARAMRGATGVVGDTGSPLLVDEATVREVALGAARKLYAGDLRANTLENQATLEGMRGENALKAASLKAQGYNAQKTSEYLQAGSSLLSSFGKFYGSKLPKAE